MVCLLHTIEREAVRYHFSLRQLLHSLSDSCFFAFVPDPFYLRQLLHSLADGSFFGLVLEDMEVQMNSASTVGNTPLGNLALASDLSMGVQALITESHSGAMSSVNFDFTASSIGQTPQEGFHVHGHGPGLSMGVQALITESDAGAMGSTNFDFKAENGSSCVGQTPQEASELSIDVPALIKETDTAALDSTNLQFTAENGFSSVGHTHQEASHAHGRGSELSIDVPALIDESDTDSLDSMNPEFTAEDGSSSVGQTPQEASHAHGHGSEHLICDPAFTAENGPELHGQISRLRFKEFVPELFWIPGYKKLRVGLAIGLCKLQYDQLASLRGPLNASYREIAEQVTVNFVPALTQWNNRMAWTAMFFLHSLGVIIVVWPLPVVMLIAAITEVGILSSYLFALFTILSGSKVVIGNSFLLPAFLFVLAESLTFSFLCAALALALLYIYWRMYVKRM